MIPKIIHYCWFGGKPLPSLATKCIESWKKYMPDYVIKEWNESNFDVNSIPYTKQAYKAKKYAFVSDYARFHVLQEHGGIYMDVDVELIKDLSPLLTGNVVMGMERTGQVAPGLILISNPNTRFLVDMVNIYKNLEFKIEINGKIETIVDHTTTYLRKLGLKQENRFQSISNEINIYPIDYFCPIDMNTNQLKITNNTYSIHHYAASWISNWAKIKRTIRKLIGYKLYNSLYALKHNRRKNNLNE